MLLTGGVGHNIVTYCTFTSLCACLIIFCLIVIVYYLTSRLVVLFFLGYKLNMRMFMARGEICLSSQIAYLRYYCVSFGC